MIDKKNKLYKKSILQIKKLHPKKGDMVLAQPNIDELGFDLFMKFFKAWTDADLFGKGTLAWAPFKVNALTKERRIKMKKLKAMRKLKNLEN